MGFEDAKLKWVAEAQAVKMLAWDVHYLIGAQWASLKSKDPSTKAGAVIVRPDKSLCSTGFNGFPRKMNDSPELYADREKKYSRTVHAEVNAQIFAREDLSDCSLYTWPFACCDRCAVQMIQSGIQRFVFPEMPADKSSRWGATMELAETYMVEAGCEVVKVPYKDIPKLVLE